MNKSAIVAGGIIAAVALFAVFYSRKATAGEQSQTNADLNWQPIDLGFSQRPYYNPNTDQGSKSMNNPLNIKWNAANNWVGQLGKNSKGFVIFDRPESCYRAGAKILASYAKRGIDTVPEILNTWAPPSDKNPTESYINFVCKETGFNRIQTITKQNYVDLLIALTKFEIGSFPYSRSVVQLGVGAA